MLTVGWLPGIAICRWHIAGADQRVLWGSILVTQPGEGPSKPLGSEWLPLVAFAVSTTRSVVSWL